MTLDDLATSSTLARCQTDTLTPTDVRDLATVCRRLPGAWHLDTFDADDGTRYAGLVPSHWGDGFAAAFWVRREGSFLVLTDRRRTADFGGRDASEGQDVTRARRHALLRALVSAAGGPVERPDVSRTRRAAPNGRRGVTHDAGRGASA